MAAPGSARFKRSAATTSRSFTWTGHSELDTNLHENGKALTTKGPTQGCAQFFAVTPLETNFLGSIGILEGASCKLYICKLLVKGENILKVGSN